jgi:hypothetical protein
MHKKNRTVFIKILSSAVSVPFIFFVPISLTSSNVSASPQFAAFYANQVKDIEGNGLLGVEVEVSGRGFCAIASPNNTGNWCVVDCSYTGVTVYENYYWNSTTKGTLLAKLTNPASYITETVNVWEEPVYVNLTNGYPLSFPSGSPLSDSITIDWNSELEICVKASAKREIKTVFSDTTFEDCSVSDIKIKSSSENTNALPSVIFTAVGTACQIQSYCLGILRCVKSISSSLVGTKSITNYMSLKQAWNQYNESGSQNDYLLHVATDPNADNLFTLSSGVSVALSEKISAYFSGFALHFTTKIFLFHPILLKLHLMFKITQMKLPKHVSWPSGYTKIPLTQYALQTPTFIIVELQLPIEDCL